jgi:hypothetical protein
VIGQMLFRPWADHRGERGSTSGATAGPRLSPYPFGISWQPKRMRANRAFMAYQRAPMGSDASLKISTVLGQKAMVA